MKTYQKPQITMQSIDIADVLTSSGEVVLFSDSNVNGNAVIVNWSDLNA